MAWFDDRRLRDIYEFGLARGVTSEDCAIIRRKLSILMATRSHRSHWLAGEPRSTPDGRSAVRVTPHWAISFEWIEEVGPFRMRLEHDGA
jgi:hypothetical protein